MSQSILVDLRKLAYNTVDLSDYNIVGMVQDYFSIQQLQELKSFYPNISTVIQNNFTMFDELPVDFYCIPYWLRFQALQFPPESPPPITTQHCFSFNINKKQINRYLLIKMVEWFNLTNFCYTWSGIGRVFDMTRIIQEFQLLKDPFTDDLKTFLLDRIKLPTYFLDTDCATPIEVPDTVLSAMDYRSSTTMDLNVATWKNFIQQQNYSSAVSLIAESIVYDKTAGFTEKTLYSVLGLNFPIWVGGFAMAEQWKSMGFDVFDDVIDHSYQYYDTLIERIYWAFKLNLAVLSDINYAEKKRFECMDRLLDNKQRLENDCLKIYIEDQEAKLPPMLVNIIKENQCVSPALKIQCYYGEFHNLLK
jgi:hypothetical protein